MSEMKSDMVVTADEALLRLKEGNKRYMSARSNDGDCSPTRREALMGGQKPYAVIMACADSRVIPEAIFQAGLGELFVIRGAGNVLGATEIGSVEYAVSHLGAKLVVVMGHEGCGAVAATLEGYREGYIEILTKLISRAVGSEKDPRKASIANAAHIRDEIRDLLGIKDDDEVKVVSAYYNLKGNVEFSE